MARLVDTPPTELNPEAMVREARKLLKGVPGVRTSVIVGPDLLKKKLRGIHAVGRTAVKAPRMFVATFTPQKASGKHVALVGKGITYDTGGLSIKGKIGMTTMKCDMGGSAATLGAFKILATTGCKHKLSLVLCLAENAIGPTAYKPDDILTMHSGKTVEINNTDAEGRLVLADGVSYAARVLDADTILDAATLTGAQAVATGNLHASIFSNTKKLEKIVVDAGFASGDLAHPLMFAPEFYKREFRSTIADMRNSVRNRGNAQASCAAQFIYWHIEDTKVAWCHVDLAAPAFIADRGTGYGTALLSETVRRL
jgi:probable aminopeptidase NPEPL1